MAERQRQQQASAAADGSGGADDSAPLGLIVVGSFGWGRRAAGFSSLAMALERGRTAGAAARWGRPRGRATAGRTTAAAAATTCWPANSLLAASIPTSLPLSPFPSAVSHRGRAAAVLAANRRPRFGSDTPRCRQLALAAFLPIGRMGRRGEKEREGR
ncbi:hypothetical protein [Oryza sativa Japonica Group]|uniref:Uncharacterized protein n=1 Tax=Oryza sativa subsp. japonica TaxID=39947 RepID=Q5VQI2_ORYSJ|nr:hypothetical protein [Oryza sativa Japonica Group]